MILEQQYAESNVIIATIIYRPTFDRGCSNTFGFFPFCLQSIRFPERSAAQQYISFTCMPAEAFPIIHHGRVQAAHAVNLHYQPIPCITIKLRGRLP